MADIAVVFHWSPEVMDAMPIGEITDWRNSAVDRWNKMNAPPKK